MNINFDDGYKEFTINNDPSRVLKVNTKDVGILERIDKSINKMQSQVDSLNEDEFKIDLESEDRDQLSQSAEANRKVDSIMRECFDEIFYPGASEIVFGNMDLHSTVNGVTVFESFLKAFSQTIGPELEEETKKREQHINKYKKAYDKMRSKGNSK